MGLLNQGLNKDSSNETNEEINNYSEIKLNEEEIDDSTELEEEEKADISEIKEEDKQITAEFIMPDISTNKNKPKEKKLKPENIRKRAFYYPMIFLKKLFKKQFKLNFDLFKCSKVFGVSIGHMRQILNLQM